MAGQTTNKTKGHFSAPSAAAPADSLSDPLASSSGDGIFGSIRRAVTGMFKGKKDQLAGDEESAPLGIALSDGSFLANDYDDEDREAAIQASRHEAGSGAAAAAASSALNHGVPMLGSLLSAGHATATKGKGLSQAAALHSQLSQAATGDFQDDTPLLSPAATMDPSMAEDYLPAAQALQQIKTGQTATAAASAVVPSALTEGARGHFQAAQKDSVLSASASLAHSDAPEAEALRAQFLTAAADGSSSGAKAASYLPHLAGKL